MKKLNLYAIVFSVLLILLILVPAACKTTEPATPAQPATPSTPSTPAEPPPEPVELSLSSLYPPSGDSALSLDRWAEKVKEESDGLLTIRHYAANTLVAAPDAHSGVIAGTTDMAFFLPYKIEPGFEVAGQLKSCINGVTYDQNLKIFNDVWNEYPDIWEGQVQDLKLIWASVFEPTFIYTVDKAVRELSDLKGLQIRVPDAVNAAAMKELGAAPVSMSTADWITSLDKGTTDGGMGTIASRLDYQIGDKLKYCTKYTLGTTTIFLAMNLDVWNSLSPDFQKVIDDSREWGLQDYIQTKRATEEKATEYLLSCGLEFIDLSADEYSHWNDLVKPVYDQIATDLDALGYPGTEMVNFALERSAYYISQ